MKKKTMKTAAKNAPATMHGEVFLQCPRCAVRMKKLKNNETIIDVCESCGGLWLDAGEIDKLAALHPRNR